MQRRKRIVAAEASSSLSRTNPFFLLLADFRKNLLLKATIRRHLALSNPRSWEPSLSLDEDHGLLGHRASKREGRKSHVHYMIDFRRDLTAKAISRHARGGCNFSNFSAYSKKPEILCRHGVCWSLWFGLVAPKSLSRRIVTL